MKTSIRRRIAAIDRHGLEKQEKLYANRLALSSEVQQLRIQRTELLERLRGLEEELEIQDIELAAHEHEWRLKVAMIAHEELKNSADRLLPLLYILQKRVQQNRDGWVEGLYELERTYRRPYRKKSLILTFVATYDPIRQHVFCALPLPVARNPHPFESQSLLQEMVADCFLQDQPLKGWYLSDTRVGMWYGFQSLKFVVETAGDTSISNILEPRLESRLTQWDLVPGSSLNVEVVDISPLAWALGEGLIRA